MQIILEDLNAQCLPSETRYVNNVGSRILYKRSETRSLDDVEKLLSEGGTVKFSTGEEALLSCRSTLLAVSKKLLGLFVPIETEAEIISKFWGAVYRHVRDVKVKRSNKISSRSLLKSLRCRWIW